MLTMRTLAAALGTVALAASLASAAPGPKPPVKPEQMGRPGAAPVKVTRQGDAFCFDRPIAYGTVIVPGGKCYTTYLVRTGGGAFLGFGPPGPPMIPPGQLVRMHTPAGQKTKGRLFLVPIPVSMIRIPVETIRYVPVQIVPTGNLLVFRFPAGTVIDGSGGNLRFEAR
jgi:hypothetical protein